MAEDPEIPRFAAWSPISPAGAQDCVSVVIDQVMFSWNHIKFTSGILKKV